MKVVTLSVLHYGERNHAGVYTAVFCTQESQLLWPPRDKQTLLFWEK